MSKKKIWCCECQADINARLANGEEIYPHRPDLFELFFWIHDECGNYVGCHNNRKIDPTEPLGCIPNKTIKKLRGEIHKLLDPLWQSGKYKRKALYALLSNKFGKEYHTADIKTTGEAKEIIEYLENTLTVGRFERPYAPDWIVKEDGIEYSGFLDYYWHNKKGYDAVTAFEQGITDVNPFVER